MNGYELSRVFFDYAFEHTKEIKPNHCAVYFFAIEHCNRLGWKKQFGFPSTMVMDAVGIRSHNTYMSVFNDLEAWGFFKVVERSKNQYSSNIIELSKYTKALGKALDKALIKHKTKQSVKQRESIGELIDSIDKQENKGTINKKPIEQTEQRGSEYEVVDMLPYPTFDDFWIKYAKSESKVKSEKKWSSLKQSEKEEIMIHLNDYIISTPDKTFRKNPMTYLNNRGWEDEIITKHNGTHNGKQNGSRHKFSYDEIFVTEEQIEMEQKERARMI